MGVPDRLNRVAQYTEARNGIAAHMRGNVRIDGVEYTPIELEAVVQEAIDAVEAAAATYDRWRDLVQAARAKEAKVAVILDLLRARLISEHGKTAHEALGAFGMKAPRPRGPRTIAAKVEAIEHAALTREARHALEDSTPPVLPGDSTPPVPRLASN